ncbi:MAG: GNAT family N-acetyltransferase [Candidatus Thorarchaeota archaeon]
MRSNKILIRPATQKDIPAVDELWKESAQYHGELDSRLAMRVDDTRHITEFHQEQLTKKTAYFLVAVDDDAVVGFSIAHTMTLQPHHLLRYLGIIDALAVTRAYRSQGIGSQLYSKTLEWFESQNVERIDTSVAAKNLKAQSFWQQKGFTPRIHHISYELQ